MPLLRIIFGFFAASLLSFSCSGSRKTTVSEGGVIIVGTTYPEKKINAADPLKTKYAVYLGMTPDKITNTRLYQFIDSWMNTPYKWGGNDKRGIDCSALMQRLFDSVYTISIPRTSVEQFYTHWIDKFRSTRHLSEGDLVFFKTVGDNVVSHVGMYLANGRFINSSSSNGVSIANINDPYWTSRLVGAGRIDLSLLRAAK